MAASDQERLIHQQIAKRFSFHRALRGVSQAALGAVFGCSFQQVQKYESGKNRISAGRLKMAADFLSVPIGIFFDEPTDPHDPHLSRKHVRVMHALAVLEVHASTRHYALCELILIMAASVALINEGVEGEEKDTRRGVLIWLRKEKQDNTLAMHL